MKLTQLTVAVACLAMAFTACQKEENLPATKQPAAATEKAEDVIDLFFRANRAEKTQVFQFEASDGTVFTGAGQTTVTVQAGVLTTLDGAVVSGPVTAKLLEVQSIADQALFGFPTQSAWSQSNPNGGGPIQTNGAVELTMTDQDGNQLTAHGNGVTIAMNVNPNTGFDPGMRIWKGAPSVDQPRDNVWVENPNEAPEQGGGETGQTNVFNWEGRTRLNIDKLYVCPGTPTPFKVDLPAPFVRSNTQIYVVAQVCGSPGPKAIFSLDMYNASPKYWYEHTAAGIPIGMNVDFVAIAKINGQLYYKIENATIVPNHFQHMTGMMPITAAGLTAILLTL